METYYSLTNIIPEKYSTRCTSLDTKYYHATQFVKAIKGKFLYSIISVGIIDMKRQIVDSSRVLYTLTDIEKVLHSCCIRQFASDVSVLDDKRIRVVYPEDSDSIESLDYHLFIFLVYLYFTCPESNISYDVWKQQILDSILSYGITTKDNNMIDFVFCALVCEHPCTGRPYYRMYSSNKKLDKIISGHTSQRSKEIENLENFQIIGKDSELTSNDFSSDYVQSYTHHYQQALEFKAQLELLYDSESSQYILE